MGEDLSAVSLRFMFYLLVLCLLLFVLVRLWCLIKKSVCVFACFLPNTSTRVLSFSVAFFAVCARSALVFGLRVVGVCLRVFVCALRRKQALVLYL